MSYGAAGAEAKVAGPLRRAAPSSCSALHPPCLPTSLMGVALEVEAAVGGEASLSCAKLFECVLACTKVVSI